MLFIITKDIIAESQKGNPKVLDLLSYLSTSLYLGKHIVWGEFNILSHLAGLSHKNEFVPQVFKSMLAMWGEMGQEIKKIKYHVEFIISQESHRDLNNKTIYINIDDIPVFEVFSETHFLAENLNDIDFFKHILEFYKKKNSLGLQNKYYPILGGGDTTCKVYEANIIFKKTLCLCIVDSDKKYEKDKLGNTYKRVELIDNKYNSFNTYAIHLENVREIENLIPLRLLNEYCKSDPELTSKFKVIEKISNKEFSLAYFDFKEGCSYKRCLDVDTEEDKTLYMLEEIFPNIENIYKEIEDRVEGLTLSKEEKNEQYKKEKIIKGFNSKILDKILELNITINEDDLTNEQKLEWERIGMYIYNWTCAGKPLIS